MYLAKDIIRWSSSLVLPNHADCQFRPMLQVSSSKISLPVNVAF